MAGQSLHQQERPASPPPRQALGLATPSQGPAQTGVVTTDTHPEKGRGLGASQAGKGRHAVRVVWTGWTLQSTLWAIQACSWQRPHWQQPRECVEMTPPGRRRSPLLTLAGKWSSSSGTINGDRLLRGSGGQCGGGAAGAEVKQHTDPKRGKAAQRGYTHTHNPYRETPIWASATTKEAHHKELHHTTTV